MNGSLRGMFCLAYHYAAGIGVKPSQTEAIKWYKKAAMAGLPEAQFIMGLRYENGSGVKKNPSEAYAFYRLAESKNEDAKDALEKLSKIMTEKELSKGNKRFEKLNI